MSPVRNRRLAAAIVATLLVGLLPATVVAADPVAVDDSFTVGVNGPATVLDVLANDEPETDLAIVDVGPAAGGDVVIEDDHLVYTPHADYHDVDTFDYTVEDGEGAQATATVTVTVNDPPIRVGPHCYPPDQYGGGFPLVEDAFLEDGYIRLSDDCAPLGDHIDPNGDPIDWVIVSQPTHGHVVKPFPDAPNVIDYYPEPDYSDTGTPVAVDELDTFTYRVIDSFGAASELASNSFWIAPINDAPSFTPGPSLVTAAMYAGPLSVPWATDISAGPPSEVAQTVHFEVETDLNGVADLFAVPPAIDGDGVLTFTPAAGQIGLVSVTVTAVDDGGSEAWEGIHWDAPAPDDTSDPVTFDILVEAAATAVDDAFSFAEDSGAHVLDVLANDDSGDVDPYTILEVSTPTKGTATITNGGTRITYTPNPDAFGPDTFTYRATGAQPATVQVAITPVQDLPVLVNDLYTTLEDTALVVPAPGVLANDHDEDGDPLTVSSIQSAPTHGGIAASAPDGSFTYVPHAHFNGIDGFTYVVRDHLNNAHSAHVTIEVGAVNHAATDAYTFAEDSGPHVLSVLANDDADAPPYQVESVTTPAKGSAIISGGGQTITYTPAAHANGTDTFTYTGTGGSTALVTIVITPINDVPIARNDAFSVDEGSGPTALTVLANDSDADFDVLKIISVSTPSKGSATITGGGTGLTYRPPAGYHGNATFSYTVSDGHGGTDPATVVVTVVKDTTPPTAIAPSIRLDSGTVDTDVVRVRIAWSGSDAGSGISAYRLQQSVDGGAWSTIALSKPSATSIERDLKSGRDYRFRVRATDGEGNVGSDVAGAPVTWRRYSEKSSRVAYLGSWSAKKEKRALGHATRAAKSPSKAATFSFSGTDVGWIASRLTTSGRAQVLVDGVLVSTVDLDRKTSAYRRLVVRAHVSTPGPHTLQVRPVGDGRVDIDGFLVLD